MIKPNKYYRIFLFIGILLHVGIFSFAQSNNSSVFLNIKVKDGLPSNKVFGITQDSLGFMWFATNDGFVRYDGYKMKTYRKGSLSNIALTNNQITAIVNGNNAKLWISSYRGLILFNSKNGESKAIDLGGIREIRCLLNQGDSIIWAGTSDGLFKINTHNYNYQIYTTSNSQLGSNIVRTLYLDSKRTLWIGTFDGLNSLASNGEMHHFNLKKNYKPELKNNLTLAIAPFTKTDDSKLWIGTETGLVLFDTNTEGYTVYNASNTKIQNEVIKCIYTKTPYEVYFGTDFGFYRLNTINGDLQKSFHNPFNNYSITNNVVWDIYEDKSGILWLATSNGISKINLSQSMFGFVPVYSQKGENTIGTQVNDIFIAKDKTIWLATKKGVIANLPNGSQKIFSADKNTKYPLVLDNINTISGDNLGRIWIGSAGGINVWDTRKNKMYTITANFDLNMGLRSNYIGAFITPPDGSFWVTTWGGGMYKVKGNFNNIENITFEYIANFNSNVFSSNKKIWITNENKIYSIDIDTNEIEIHKKLNEYFKDDNITSMQITSKGELWIGTHNLLTCYNITTQKTISYRIFNGTDSDIINLLEDYQGNIWGTTLTSIFKLSAGNQNIETFPKSTGIPLDNFLYQSEAISSTGQLYFGGNDGYITFNPNDIKKNSFEPEIILTDFSVNNIAIESLNKINQLNKTNELIPYADKSILKFQQNSFTIAFSSSHYGEPERNIYEYKLDGYDDGWNYTTGINNYASYSNLNAGKYTFIVRGTNNDGVWSNNEKTFKIIVKPPVWASPTAIIIYIVLLQIAFVLLFMIYRNKVKWKQKIQAITLEKEKNEEMAKTKQQFFTNISHEFRTPLSLILGPAETLRNNNLNSHDFQLVDIINKNARRLYSLVNQLLDLRKIELNTLQLKTERADIIELCQRQYNLFIDLAESNKFNYTFKSHISTLLAEIDVAKLESIIQNLLSNAFKYTKDTVDFTVRLTENNLLEITIKDNGLGIDEDICANIFTRFYQGNNLKKSGYGIGLNITKEYCELMNGKISFDSEKNQGTVFTVEFPIYAVEINETQETVTQISHQHKNQESIVQNSNYQSILLVDDNPDTLNYLKLNLGNKFQIRTALNGEDAFLQLEKHDIDLIISDIMMPKVDGIEFCKKVKKHPKYENIPLILLTAKTLENNVIEGYKAGSDAYITKPFEMQVLMAKIESLLGKSKKLKAYIKKQLIVENQQVEIESNDEKLLHKTIQYINSHMSDPDINLEKLCKNIGVSHSNLYRKIKAQTGMTLNELIRTTRLKHAASLIKTEKYTIAEIMAETGFTNHSYFAKCFKKEYKVSPREYKG